MTITAYIIPLAHSVVKHATHATAAAASARPSAHRPLVVMHGLFGSKQNWQSLSKALARSAQADVWTVDLRNHGESLPHSRDMTIPDMARDVAAFVKEQGLERPVLIGHSMGGKVAMHTALAHPSLFSGVMSLDMAPVAFKLSLIFPTYISTMQLVDAAHVTKQTEADAILKKYIPDTGVRMFLMTNLKRQPDGTLKFRVPLGILAKALPKLGEFPLPAPGATFGGPTMILGATRADYVRPSMLDEVRTMFPQCELEMMEAGHWLHAERPADVMEKIVGFVERVRRSEERRE
ncbi:Alpha/Beta hydrolase protein [Catenaria anguillulae PL171]|uniref:Alpha/Beta hydrolase protein n=1 Tax=Catenaria anguillulae PL171 TaxID=765915 RepID=A0A1Y2I1T0_9FUNG|nr:Alpha/Beta hydrolase protein [Catenaria anguillulae PL171]